MQRTAGFTGRDRRASFEKDRTRVETCFHLHQIHAAFAVAGEDRALDRRRAAPARQQRGVHVPATQARQCEHAARKNQSVGDDDEEIGGVVLQTPARIIVLQCFRLLDRNARGERALLDRTCEKLAPAPGRTIRLRVDRDDVDRRIEARLKTRQRELRRSREHQAQS